MNKNIAYTSIFSSFFYDFIQEKELRNINTNHYKYIFKEFDCFFMQISKNNLFITSTDIKNWSATRVNDQPNTLYQKYCVIAQFCRYMCLLGYDCFIPRRPKCPQRSFIPAVFSHKQMQNIFDACDALAAKERQTKCIIIIMPALLRLLYSTGIRVGEALSIRNKDVDFERKVIVLNNTKNKCQRLAPINQSLESVLKQYVSYRDKIPIHSISNPDSIFFVSLQGKPCSKCSVLKYFHRILEKCDIQRLCEHPSPCVHSIRHTAAVHSLVKLTKSGKDLYCSLPLLATFMGHKNVLDTEYYLRLTQEMYPDLMKMDTEATEQIYSLITTKIRYDYENENN